MSGVHRLLVLAALLAPFVTLGPVALDTYDAPPRSGEREEHDTGHGR